jgi:hypothetical protein
MILIIEDKKKKEGPFKVLPINLGVYKYEKANAIQVVVRTETTTGNIMIPRPRIYDNVV